MRLFMTSGISSSLTVAVGANKRCDKFPGISVDPLVNGLMTDRQFRVQFFKASSNKFRGPTVFDPTPNIFTNFIILEPLVRSGSNGSVNGAFLSLMGQIIAPVNWRGIALEFSRDSGWISVERFSDISD